MRRGDFWANVAASEWVFWPVCLAALGLVALGVLGPVAARRNDLLARCEAMEAEVEALAETESRLEAAVEALETDPRYAERVIRHELGVTRPGEIRLPLPPEADPPGRAVPAAPTRRGHPLLAFVGRLSDPVARLAAILAGGVLLATAMLLGLPADASPRRRARRRKGNPHAAG